MQHKKAVKEIINLAEALHKSIKKRKFSVASARGLNAEIKALFANYDKKSMLKKLKQKRQYFNHKSIKQEIEIMESIYNKAQELAATNEVAGVLRLLNYDVEKKINSGLSIVNSMPAKAQKYEKVLESLEKTVENEPFGGDSIAKTYSDLEAKEGSLIRFSDYAQKVGDLVLKVGDEVKWMLKESYLQKLGSSLRAKTIAVTALATIVLSAISIQVNPAGLAGKIEAMVTKNPAAISMFYEAGAAEYMTVDDILVSVKNKVFVNKDTYLDEVRKSEKAVVFFYNSSDLDGYGGNLAKVHRSVINKFSEVKLICYDKDREGFDINWYYHQFGLKSSPYTIFVSNGNCVYKIDGGPKSIEQINKWKKIFSKIIKDKIL